MVSEDFIIRMELNFLQLKGKKKKEERDQEEEKVKERVRECVDRGKNAVFGITLYKNFSS